MRPQQNRRMRGRNNNNNNNNNNNRRGPNPLSRNYESNGPDVKIRGNAQHIADKYTTLARDAQASGDRVIAENYLQHAEHYIRIILAAQEHMALQQSRNEDNDDNDDNENTVENVDVTDGDDVSAPAGSGPQPDIDGVPAEVALNENIDDNAASRPRRAPRRRNIKADSEQTDTQKADEVEPDTNVEVEKPRRRRRTVKTAEAES